MAPRETHAEQYDDAARARWAAEAAKPHARTPFERDRARIVHSAALRRLAAKTQVVGPQSDDFVRNRLTHTLEVAQVARDLARRLGCDPDVVETAALAHDLGHPPFGHNGERALDELCDAAGGFEGNAQTLRVLTRLEAKGTHPDGSSAGLNLTRASLDASTKYPWLRSDAPPSYGAHSDGTLRTTSKFGVYDDDQPVFTWLREGAPEGRRCLEAQVMDLSDDVAYSVHDVEDGIVAGRIELTGLEPELEAVWATVREWYLPDATDDDLAAAVERLRRLDAWPTSTYDGSRRSLAALKNLTSTLIGRFCQAATSATQERFGREPLARYEADLVVPGETWLEIGVLKGVAAQLVMRAQDRRGLLDHQRTVLTDLVEHLLGHPERIGEPFRHDLMRAASDAARLRVVVDQVASLTDASALAWHARRG